MGRMTNECMGGRGSYRGYGTAGRTNTNEHRYDKGEPTAKLIVLIEKVWKEYQDLQDQYRKLTGREHEWLK